MEEMIQAIIEKVEFEKKEKLIPILDKCINVSDDSSQRTNASYENILFKTGLFFKELAKCLNDVPKAKRLPLGVHILEVVLEELGFELEKEDAFVIFELKDLGKFKIREAKLHEQLKALWGEYRDYALSDQDFSRTLRVLMKIGIINYRKGNLALKNEFLIRYKN